MRSRRFAWQLGGVAAAALLARVAYVALVGDGIELGLDSTIYKLLSGQIAAHGRFIDPGAFFNEGIVRPTASYPPLYPTVLAAVGKVFGASSFHFQLAGAVTGSLTVVLVGVLGRRIAGDAVGVTAAAIAGVYPLLLASDASVMTETIYVPLVLGCVLMVYRIGDEPTTWRWVGLGALLGVAALTRVDALVLAPLLAAVAASHRRGRTSLAFAGVTVLVAVGVISPWLVRNERRVGEPTLATVSSAATVAGANCPSTYYGPKIGTWDFACIQSERQAELGELRWSRTVRRAGASYATHHLTRVPLVAAVRLARLWGLYHPLSQARSEADESRNYRWQVFGWFVYIVLAPIAVVGAVLLLRRRVWLAPLLGVIVGVNLTALASYGNQRFRIVAEPILAITAAAAIVSAARRFRAPTGPAGGQRELAAGRDATPARRGAAPVPGARPS